MSTHNNIKKSAIAALQRMIGQAIQEGATEAQIREHMIAEGVTDPDPIIARVKGFKMIPLLGGVELKLYGGRNKFRAIFGLHTAVEPLPSAEEEDFPLTESGDAEHFAEVYADKVRYDHRRGRWLLSDDVTGLWLVDPTDQMLTLALEAQRARQKRALMIEDQAKRKPSVDWTMRGENLSRLQHLMKIAQSLPPLADDGSHWDEQPFLLGCLNGVIDLRTGSCRAALPSERITMQIPVAYDRSVRSTLWEDTLRAIFATPKIDSSSSPADLLAADTSMQEMVDYVQRAFGYTATGDCSEECCFFMYGEGANGKGTLTQTMQALFGVYHNEMPASTLVRSQFGNGIPTDLADLDGKRFVTNAELQEFTVNEARLKALTGRDSITARFMREDFFTFVPVCKIWIATNNKPKIVGQDDGIWRRIHLIPFLNRFEGATDNKNLKDELRHHELQGILTWAVDGAIDWYWTGLRPPAAVVNATKEYRAESDGLTQFIDAYCTTGPLVKVIGRDIWTAYQHWCEESRVDLSWRMSQKAFFQGLGKRFTKRENKQGQAEYYGVALMDRAGHRADSGF
jgi:putative DNA primase/helicase